MRPVHKSDFTDGQVLLANVSSFLHSLGRGHYVAILFFFFSLAKENGEVVIGASFLSDNSTCFRRNCLGCN